MQEIQSREYERKLQLLPGSAEREAALVDSVEELKAQMDQANEDNSNKAKSTRNKFLVVSTIVIVGGLFLSGVKLSTLLKSLGTVLAIGALVKGANNSDHLIKELPRSDEFSAMDRAYTWLGRLNRRYNKSEFLQLIVKATLDTMVATKLIKPQEIRDKQNILKSNRVRIKDDVKEAILSYGNR